MVKTNDKSVLKRKYMGTWVAQSIKCLPLVQVMIPGSWDSSLSGPCSVGSMLLPLLPSCAVSPHFCCYLCLFLSNKSKIKDNASERQECEAGVRDWDTSPPQPCPFQENRGGKQKKIKDKYVHSRKKFLGPNTMIPPRTWPVVSQSTLNLSLNFQGLPLLWPFVPNPYIYARYVYFIHISLIPNLPIKYHHQFS